MKYVIYRPGERNELKTVILTAVEVVRERTHKRKITPSRSLKIYNHSPTGFEFGYGGSGPAQLALAILLDFTNDRELALRHHQEFKWDFVTHWVHPGAEIEDKTIRQWLNQKENQSKK